MIVSPTRRGFPEATDYWDGNALYAVVTVEAGAFRGNLEAQFRADEFLRFRDHLRPLYEKATGRAVFDTMEGWLRIEIEGDGKGHFQAYCKADDQPGMGNRLAFYIGFDQTELPAILRGSTRSARRFPSWDRRRGQSEFGPWGPISRASLRAREPSVDALPLQAACIGAGVNGVCAGALEPCVVAASHAGPGDGARNGLAGPGRASRRTCVTPSVQASVHTGRGRVVDRQRTGGGGEIVGALALRATAHAARLRRERHVSGVGEPRRKGQLGLAEAGALTLHDHVAVLRVPGQTPVRRRARSRGHDARQVGGAARELEDGWSWRGAASAAILVWVATAADDDEKRKGCGTSSDEHA